MAGKHPKDRRIPRTLLKVKALKGMENRVIMWVHVLELIVILFAAAVTVSTAFFIWMYRQHPTLSNNLHNNAIENMSDKAKDVLGLEPELKSTETTKSVEDKDSKDTTVKTVNKEANVKIKDEAHRTITVNNR